MNNKKIVLMIGICIAFLLLGNFVNAFGTSYIFERPLSLYPDQTKNIYVTLQNNNDENPITAKATLKQNIEVAKLTDGLDTFIVPYLTSVQVNFSVTAPKNAKIGDIYNLSLKFIPQATSESGMGIVFATGVNLDVLIVERPTQTTQEIKELPSMTGVLVFIVLAVVIIAIILLIIIRKKRKKQK